MLWHYWEDRLGYHLQASICTAKKGCYCTQVLHTREEEERNGVLAPSKRCRTPWVSTFAHLFRLWLHLKGGWKRGVCVWLSCEKELEDRQCLPQTYSSWKCYLGWQSLAWEVRQKGIKILLLWLRVCDLRQPNMALDLTCTVGIWINSIIRIGKIKCEYVKCVTHALCNHAHIWLRWHRGAKGCI